MGQNEFLSASGRVVGNFSPYLHREMIAICYGLEQAKLLSKDLGMNISHVGIMFRQSIRRGYVRR